MSIKQIISKFIPKKLIRLRHEWRLKKYRKESVEEIFSNIYSTNEWDGPEGEFSSGYGTLNKDSEKYVRAIVDLVKKRNLESILDIGCGDFSIMSRIVKEADVHFTGADVAANIIERNTRKFSSEKIKFLHLNAITGILPQADLVTIRQVLQHLDNDQVKTIVNKAIEASRWVVITEHLPFGEKIVYNLDKHAGPDIRMYNNLGVFLEKSPFNFELVETVLEYREDFDVYGEMKPAVLRTSLIRGARS